MIWRAKKFLRRRWRDFRCTPFGGLLRLFVGRMFHGGSETDADALGMGVGVLTILLAMPGLLASLLMLEEYGSLIRYMRGDGVFDPFVTPLPDEYFFIVLSMFVTGVAALWRWDSIFLDRRDYMNLVPLPVRLSDLFWANLCAVMALAGFLSIVANVFSVILFPAAVLGSQNSVLLLLRFAAGHAFAVMMASAFGFWLVFAVAGVLLALVPARVFRSVSLAARFAIGIVLLGLVGSVFSVSRFAMDVTQYRAGLWPPFCFLGLARTLWGRSAEPLVAKMAMTSFASLASVILVSLVAYAISFRKAFIRIPEVAEAGPLPRATATFSFSGSLTAVFLRPPQRACYQFVAKTLLRSEQHLQVLMGFMAVGVVVAANLLKSAPGGWVAVVSGGTPSVAFLSVPLILSYCSVAGIRFAFEMPADLRANWIFILLLEHRWKEARRVSRRVLLVFCLSWLAPAIFLTTLFFFGWRTALLHSLILIICTVGLIELSLFKFRKIPFTCSYPPFQSHSGLIAVLYFFGFLGFTTYTAQMEYWAMLSPWRVILFIPLFLAVVLGLHAHRKQMLDMDKELIFEEVPATRF
jgi:hypothetical protein